jgi:hypothetical protein
MEKPVKTRQSKPRPEALRFRPVRLVHMPAMEANGEPRIALEVPPRPGSASRRAALIVFGSMAMALSAKREIEGVP